MYHALVYLLFGLLNLASAAPPLKYLDPQLLHPAPHEERFESGSNFAAAKRTEWDACHRSPFDATLSALPTQSTGSLRYFAKVAILDDLAAMESRGLLKGAVAQQPWSGDYWPYARGLIAQRYAQDAFNNLPDWLSRFQFVSLNTAQDILSREGDAGMAELSPAEKYDLLVGQANGALTAAMWKQGQDFYKRYGKVEEWMGICHGWAPAATIEPRPVHSIDVAAGGMTVHLNPSDLKGLVSYAWATNSYNTISLGTRCDKKDPARDENGRIIDPECFDINPALLHRILVTRVGLEKRSFIMDATYDFEVWNQPILSYSYSYFNPKTRRAAKTLNDATVSRQDFAQDRFAKYRGSKTDSIVGISLTLAYTKEVAANLSPTDSPDDDAIRYVKYDYDLELDRTGKIIGGEWYQIEHPDFIWAPQDGARPEAYLDSYLDAGAWSGGNSDLPSKWIEAAHQSSPSGTVLETIVRALLSQAAN